MTAPTSIEVNKINFVGNTVFSDRELNEILPPITKPISLERLFYLRKLITDYYVDRGYISSGAFIPPQGLKNGELNIRIVEGSLERIEIEGLRKLDKDYLTARLPQLNEPLKLEELAESLESLEEESFISGLRANLNRSSVGKNVLTLEIEEENPLQSEFAVTNGYSPSVGALGGVARASYHLLGLGDFFRLEYGRTEGLSRISTSYSLPLNSKGTSIAFGYTNANTEAIEDPISALDIQADFEEISFGLSQQIANFGSNQITLGLKFDSINSETFIDGDFSFAFVEGLEDGKSRINALRLSQEFSSQKQNSLFIASSQFNVGLDVFDTTVNNTGTDGLFWSWQGTAQWHQRFSSLSSLASLNLQFSPDTLLPLEQIAMGGSTSVRGYRQNLTIGDNGIVGSLELRVPLVDSSIGKFEVVPFVDVGTVWNNSDEEIANDFLASLGIGIGYELADSVRARLDYGIPLVELDNELESGSGTQAISFLLSIQP